MFLPLSQHFLYLTCRDNLLQITYFLQNLQCCCIRSFFCSLIVSSSECSPVSSLMLLQAHHCRFRFESSIVLQKQPQACFFHTEVKVLFVRPCQAILIILRHITMLQWSFQNSRRVRFVLYITSKQKLWWSMGCRTGVVLGGR